MTRPNLPRAMITTGLALVVGVLAPLSAPGAEPARPAEPAKPAAVLPVSSDGAVVSQAELDALPNLTMVPATAGTGVPGKDGAVHDGDTSGQVLDESTVDSIIGTDDRYRTSPANWHPASATVQLTRIRDGARIQYCTGWLIGPDTVITAGHCVYRHNDGGWRSGQGVLVYPGRDAGSTPYGSCGAVSFHSNTAWVNDANADWDVGAIKLNCTVGTSTGTFGFRWQSASLNGTSTYVRGYPCDKPYGEQWASFDQIRSSAARRLYYQNDTWNCHSGSPVYTYAFTSCGACALAVHAYGGTTNNNGPRITQEVFDFFQYWRGL